MNNKPVAIVVSLLIIIVAGLGAWWWQSQNSTAPSPTASTITSDDGVVTLTIPAGALPAGVTASDITITKQTDPVVAYQFAPDGVIFLEPIQLSMTLPGPLDRIPSLVYSSNDTSTVVPELAVVMDYTANTIELSAELEHFSTVYEADFFTLDFTDPGSYYIPEIWPFQIDWKLASYELEAWHTDDNGSRLVKILQVDPWSVSGQAEVASTSELQIKPESVEQFPKLTELTNQSSFSAYENFKCVKPGDGGINYTFTLSWLYSIDGEGDTFGQNTKVTLYWPLKCLDIVTGTTEAETTDDSEVTTGGGTNANTANDNTNTEPELAWVDVLDIGGGLYPVEQFRLAEPDACGEQHWHASGTVYTLDLGGSATDSDPTGCGFGTVAEVPTATVEIETWEYEVFREGIK